MWWFRAFLRGFSVIFRIPAALGPVKDARSGNDSGRLLCQTITESGHFKWRPTWSITLSNSCRVCAAHVPEPVPSFMPLSLLRVMLRFTMSRGGWGWGLRSAERTCMYRAASWASPYPPPPLTLRLTSKASDQTNV